MCFVASGNSVLVHGSAGQLLGVIKQTKNRARLLLATLQCRLALTHYLAPVPVCQKQILMSMLRMLLILLEYLI